MNYKELIGKKLIGIGKTEENNVFLFLENGSVKLVSDNKDYSWFSNWRIDCFIPEYPSRESMEYKSIGRTITAIESEYDLDTDNIDADMDKWIAKVGKGYWGATCGEPYTLFTIKTTEKDIAFGTTYIDCHYPKTWVNYDFYLPKNEEVELMNKTKGLTFTEAMTAAIEGKKVRQSVWDEGRYAHKDCDSTRICWDRGEELYLFESYIKGNDWEILEEPQLPLSAKEHIVLQEVYGGNVAVGEKVYWHKDVKDALKKFIFDSGMINNQEYRILAKEIFGEELLK